MAHKADDAAPVPSGVPGLDHVTRGGYAANRSHLIEGRPGSGLSETVHSALSEVGRLKPDGVVFDSLSEIRLLCQGSLRYPGGVTVFPRPVAAEHRGGRSDPSATSGTAVDLLAGGGLARGTSTLIMGPVLQLHELLTYLNNERVVTMLLCGILTGAPTYTRANSDLLDAKA